MSRKSAKPAPSRIPLAVGVAIGAIVIVTVVVIFKRDTRTTAPPSVAPPRNQLAPPVTRVISPAVYRVAARFVCICGACGEKPLERCDCPTAVEERGFIELELASGRTEAEAADALQAKYGGRKAANDIASALTDEQIVERQKQGSIGVGHLATLADRDHIITHFKCPCEQCAIDELRDCECHHPNGAQEVKQFIDTTIAKQRHSVGEIVALVEQRYGGRIR